MTDFPRKYIVDENNNRIAAQLDLSTFEKIEEILENYALVKLMIDQGEENLTAAEAKAYYGTLGKAE